MKVIFWRTYMNWFPTFNLKQQQIKSKGQKLRREQQYK